MPVDDTVRDTMRDTVRDTVRDKTRPGGLATWLESRAGLGQLQRFFVGGSVPGGASLWHALGSTAAFLVVLEIVTGIFLGAYYAPTVAGAWASVAYIQDQLTLGWCVRGLHSFGSSALIVVTGLHLLQVLLFGAYKAPRELNWILGLGLLGIVVVFALSGYLLPWDQKGYWAKVVEATILGNTPVVGPELQKLIQGGAAFGNITLARAYTMHATALPLLLLGLIGFHVYLARRHGLVPKWAMADGEAARRMAPFWPDQAARNAAVGALAFTVVMIAVLHAHGPDLEAPADPGASYLARPEWYALPLFQLRMFFEGPTEIIATMVIPGVASGLLIALPFVDRGPTHNPARRPVVMAGALVGVIVMGLLSGIALRKDATDPHFAQARAIEKEKASTARRLALQGVPPEGGAAVFRNDPLFTTRELWDEKCAGCHSLTGQGGDKGPDLKGYNTRAWILGFLKSPDGPLYMGPAKLVKGMRPVEGTTDELRALTELVYAETGAKDIDAELIAQGHALFPDKDCDSCHELDGRTESGGPNLKGRGTLAWVIDVISDAGAGRLFSERNKMPRFASKLTHAEIEALAAFVISQKDKK